MENSPIVGFHPSKHKRMASKNTADSLLTEFPDNDNRIDSNSYLFTPQSFHTIENSLSRNEDPQLTSNVSEYKQKYRQSKDNNTFTQNWQDTVKGYKSFIQQKIKESCRLKKCSKLINKISKNKKQDIDETFQKLDQHKMFRKKDGCQISHKKTSSSKILPQGLSKILSYETLGSMQTDKENQLNTSNFSSFRQLQTNAKKKLASSNNYEMKRYNSSRNNYNAIKYSQGQLKSENNREESKITEQLDFSKYVNNYLHQKIRLLRESLQVKQYNTRKMNQHYAKMMQKMTTQHSQTIRNMEKKHQMETIHYVSQIQRLKSQLKSKQQEQSKYSKKSQQKLLVKSNNMLKQQLKISLENKAMQQMHIEQMINQRQIIEEFEKRVVLLVRENQILKKKLNENSQQQRGVQIYFEGIAKEGTLKLGQSIINDRQSKSSRSMSKDEENLLASFQTSQYCILEMTNQKKNICEFTDSLMYSQQLSTGRKQLGISIQRKCIQMTQKKNEGTDQKVKEKGILQEMDQSQDMLL